MSDASNVNAGEDETRSPRTDAHEANGNRPLARQ